MKNSQSGVHTFADANRFIVLPVAVELLRGVTALLHGAGFVEQLGTHVAAAAAVLDLGAVLMLTVYHFYRALAWVVAKHGVLEQTKQRLDRPIDWL